jgi:trimethylamine--corrinoid protein Co-methyltransferase
MGMLELGITFSFEQLLIDAAIVKMIKRTLQGMAVNDETLAVEVIKSVGAGGSYLSQKHTRRFMDREQTRSKLIDRRMRDRWMARGGLDMAQRAHEEARKLLGSHKPAPLDPAVKKQLRHIIEKAEAECTEGRE